MNYYPFHLGDYATHTAHLEPMEDLAYRRMLDLYYRTEAPLPIDPSEIARLIRLRDHAATVRDVLNEFFTQTDDGWRHKRCDAELAIYAAMSEGGKRGAAKRWAKPSDSPPIAPLSPPYLPPNANQEPRTKNQEIQKTQPPQSESETHIHSEPSGFAAFWDAWPKSARKVARKTCALKWQKLKLSSQAETILSHIEAMKSTKQWTSGYEPAPLTYLNDERWRDGLPDDVSQRLTATYERTPPTHSHEDGP